MKNKTAESVSYLKNWGFRVFQQPKPLKFLQYNCESYQPCLIKLFEFQNVINLVVQSDRIAST